MRRVRGLTVWSCALLLLCGSFAIAAPQKTEAPPPPPAPSAPTLPTATASAPTATPSAAPPSAPAAPTSSAPTTPPTPPAAVVVHGVLVVAADPSVRGAAKALARAVYGDAALRPPIDEAMARVLVGEPLSPQIHDERADVAAVVASLPSVKNERVRARLLYSLGEDLHVQMVLLVTPEKAGPSARVVRVAQRRFSSVTLVATRSADGKGWDWSDALVIARGLLTAPPPGPLSHPKGPTVVGEPDDDMAFYESPWFWTGAGLVVAAGAVVFILTQTSPADAPTINLKGRVAP